MSLKFLKIIFDTLKSLKFAVVIIVLLGLISAVGTIYEARYDADYAQRLVYKSVYMYTIMILLCASLLAVMVDRWPWKVRHAPFVLAHIGIIVLVFGSWVTQNYGIDGSMAFQIGQSNKYVTVGETEVSVFATTDGSDYRRLYVSEVNFFKNNPKNKPLEIKLGQKTIKIKDYYHYALREDKIVESKEKTNSPSIRFQIFNDNMSFSNWIHRPKGKSFESLPLGPAKVILARKNYQPQGGNEIIFVSDKRDPGKLRLKVYSQRLKKIIKNKWVQAGDVVDTGYRMGLKLRILKYIPNSKFKSSFTKKERPNDNTNSAILVEYNGQDYWMSKNSINRFYDKDKAYVLSYGNRRIELNFPIFLKNFQVGRYQGTMRAASYQSIVSVPGRGDIVISMNEPLKHKGYTFYQASFQEDETGRPTTSILSVNWDPGRWLKYLGSFLIVFGSILLFYFKKTFAKASKKKGELKL